jgi:hypothetical protein
MQALLPTTLRVKGGILISRLHAASEVKKL